MAKSSVLPAARAEQRRSAILAVAWRVFHEKGYSGASMSDIAEQLGGSKGTLYKYFRSKEELFIAVARYKGEEVDAKLAMLPRYSENLADDLTSFGCGFLKIILSGDYMDFYRMMVAEVSRFPMIGEMIHAGRRLTLLEEPFAQRITQEMEAGLLRPGDPMEAAEAFWDQCSASVHRRALLALTADLTPKEIRRLVDRAVAFFFAVYGLPDESRRQGKSRRPRVKARAISK